MTPRSEIDNRPINQAAAYWMRPWGRNRGGISRSTNASSGGRRTG